MRRMLRKGMMWLLAAVLLVSCTLMLRQQIYYHQAQQAYQQAQTIVRNDPATVPAEPAVSPEPEVPQEEPKVLPDEPEVPLAETPHIPEPLPEPQQAPLEEQARYLETLDLDALRRTNPDVLGWISIPGTQLDYPVLQSEDNQYYLTHTWEKQRNSAGSVFLECQLSGDFSEFNTILYGHNMKNGSMFGSLRQYRTQSHYEANPHIYMTDGETIRRYEIFAAFEAEVTGYTYRLDINTPEKKQALLDYSLARSVIDAEAVPTPEDAVITLSTCTGNGYDTRWVVQAVLTGQFPVETAEPAAPAAEHCNGSLPESGGTDG